MHRDIYLTTLTEPPIRKDPKFYSCEENGEKKYCDAIMSVEAGTKYILSRQHIDEIIVIGANASYDEGDALARMELYSSADYLEPDINQLSAYSLFRYRISQYIAETNADMVDWSMSIEPERQKALRQVIKDYYNNDFKPEVGLKKSKRFFWTLDSQRESIEELRRRILASCAEAKTDFQAEWKWSMWYIYQSLGESNKMCSRQDNEGVHICFIPTNNHDDQMVDINNINMILRAISHDGEDEADLYIDMTGGNKTDSYILMSILTILTSQQDTKVRIKKVLATRTTKSGIAYAVQDDTSGYRISNLLTGMNAFVRYGKVDAVQEYFETENIHDSYTEALLMAMHQVDSGISLCDIGTMTEGIERLKYIFNNRELAQNANPIVKIIEDSIRRDYGPLLEGEEIDTIELVRWSYRKKFFQQTLTIIESWVPAYLVKKGVLYYCRGEEEKAEVMDRLNRIHYGYRAYERWRVDENISHYFFKYSGINDFQRGQTPSENMWNFANYTVGLIGQEMPEDRLNVYTDCTDLEALRDLLFSYNNMGPVRNSTNHAQGHYQEWIISYKTSSESQMYQDITQAIDYFFLCYEKVEKLMKDHVSTSLSISEDELKDYAYNHKLKGNDKKDSKPAADVAEILENMEKSASASDETSKPSAAGTTTAETTAVPADSVKAVEKAEEPVRQPEPEPSKQHMRRKGSRRYVRNCDK